MPGRQWTAFRSGNLAEQVGFLLLKSLAAVAEVPRTEDFGLDAVATLLRRDEDGNSYAEDSFLVQLKSDSKTDLNYKDHELSWLSSQELPLFLGIVSRGKARICLYPMIHVNQALLALKPSCVRIRLGKSTIPPLLGGFQESPWRDEKNGTVSVWLGDPILEWSISDTTDTDWERNAYETMKAVLRALKQELLSLSLGHIDAIQWCTNDPGSVTSKWAGTFGNLEIPSTFLRHGSDFLRAAMMQVSQGDSDQRASTLAALVALIAAYQNQGIDFDSGGEISKISAGLLHSAIRETDKVDPSD